MNPPPQAYLDRLVLFRAGLLSAPELSDLVEGGRLAPDAALHELEALIGTRHDLLTPEQAGLVNEASFNSWRGLTSPSAGARSSAASFPPPSAASRPPLGRLPDPALEPLRVSSRVLGICPAIPDPQVTVGLQVAEGEWVASRVTALGPHLGGWLGMTATGRPVVVTGVDFDRVVDGKIVEHGGAANMLEALLSFGAIRPVGPGEEDPG